MKLIQNTHFTSKKAKLKKKKKMLKAISLLCIVLKSLHEVDSAADKIT